MAMNFAAHEPEANRPRHVAWHSRGLLLACLLASGQMARAANLTAGSDFAVKFGVHEIVLTDDGSAANPFDTVATVTFVPPSGEKNAKVVHAFFDGGNTWRARVYVSETGTWTWTLTA